MYLEDALELIVSTNKATKVTPISSKLRKATYLARYGEMLMDGLNKGKWKPLIKRIVIDLNRRW